MKRTIAWMMVLVSPILAEEHVVFRCDFESAIEDSGPGLIAQGRQGSRSLEITTTASGTTSRVFPIPADRLNQSHITLRAAVRAENVSTPPNPWNGIKVMLVLETATGMHYPQISIPVGSFDWRDFDETFRTPENIRKATLVVGLEQVSGLACFDNLQVSTGRPARKGIRYDKPFNGHNLPRLRGVMYGPTCRPDDLTNLAREWKANQIRWQLNWVPMKEAEEWAADLKAFDEWLHKALEQCDNAIHICQKEGILVLVDLHCPPGGRGEGGVCRLFQQKQYQDYFLDIWEQLAARYKSMPNVYAFDLLNEAVEGAVAPGLMNWRDLAAEATRRIRRIDPDRAVVFEPSPWGAAVGFDTLEPLPLEKVIYSFHMYEPFVFTHQGIYNNPAGVAYPGVISGRTWDRKQLAEVMRPAREFQQEFNVQIYVGEFSVIRWAPGNSGLNWLTDVVGLMDDYGWDWSYHAYREWDGWSLEHGPDRADTRPPAESTPRLKYMLEQFAKNQQYRIMDID